jgi:hypothetical protein
MKIQVIGKNPWEEKNLKNRSSSIPFYGRVKAMIKDRDHQRIALGVALRDIDHFILQCL